MRQKIFFKTSLFTPFAGHFVFNQEGKPFLPHEMPCSIQDKNDDVINLHR